MLRWYVINKKLTLEQCDQCRSRKVGHVSLDIEKIVIIDEVI
jgi:hypothetical protein